MIARLRYSLTPEEIGTVSMAGREEFRPGIGKNDDEDEERGERIRGRRQTLQGNVEGSDRSDYLDDRSR